MSSPSTPAGWAGAAPLRTGVGLRGVHHADWVASRPACGWLEAHAENYFAAGGPLPALLEDLHRDYPLSIHGVGLGLGGCDEPDRDHLAQLAALVRRHQPEVLSEHLCWGSHAGVHFNDLLPLPFNAETLARVCARVDALQSAIGRTVLIEHLASYVVFPESTVPEVNFLAELTRRTGCGLLLDLNNLHVNAVNHGFDALAFLDALPAAAIGEIHLAGHTPALVDGETVLIDTHGSAVCEAVWTLYREALQRFGPIPTLIEWDTDVPRLEVLLAEAARADVEAVAPGVAGSPTTPRPDRPDRPAQPA